MNEEWKTWSFRKRMIDRIEQRSQKFKINLFKSAYEVEDKLFSQSNSSNDYIIHVSKFLILIKNYRKMEADINLHGGWNASASFGSAGSTDTDSDFNVSEIQQESESQQLDSGCDDAMNLNESYSSGIEEILENREAVEDKTDEKVKQTMLFEKS